MHQAERKNVLVRLYEGEMLGTRFRSNVSHMESRKRWVLTGVTEHRGGVLVDDGAASAVRNGGTSLLPAGVADVEGDFGRGEIIAIKNAGRRRWLPGVSQTTVRTTSQSSRAESRERSAACLAANTAPKWSTGTTWP